MNYKRKYLKYKYKYLSLKKIENQNCIKNNRKQLGGDYDEQELYPTIKTVKKIINNDKILKLINKKIAPVFKKKIGLNIYFVPWYLGSCDDNGDCHLVNYNPYDEYLDVYHENWEEGKYLLIGLEIYLIQKKMN